MQNLDTLLKEILLTPLVGAMMERGIKPPQSVDMVTLAESLCFGPPKQSSQERFVSDLGKRPMSTWTDEEMHKYSIATDQPCPECGLTSGDKCHATCSECGDETCKHGGCGDPHCLNYCFDCGRKAQLQREADAEAAFQRDVAGPLLGLDEEQQ